jgi:hypothetical protein
MDHPHGRSVGHTDDQCHVWLHRRRQALDISVELHGGHHEILVDIRDDRWNCVESGVQKPGMYLDLERTVFFFLASDNPATTHVHTPILFERNFYLGLSPVQLLESRLGL